MRARILVVLALSLSSAGPLHGQSLFNAAGIGLPIDALDGRARALGSLGIGLPGTTFLPADPASAARLLVPGGLMVIQPTWVDLTRDGTAGHTYFRGSRFPLFAGGYPVSGGMVLLHATSVFDQAFVGERSVTVDLGGTTAQATDSFEQDGAVSALSAGYARMVTPTTAVGLTVGRYTGAVTRRLLRQFSDSASSNQVLPYGSAGTWSYSGYQATAGVSSDVLEVVRIAVSATVSTELEATATSTTAGSDRSFSMPLQLRLGASSQLAPGLTLSASATRANWSGTADDLSAGTQAGTATSFGAGLELSQARIFGRTTPLRLGFQRRGLPFSLEGEDAHEQAFSGGLGFALNEVNEVVLASVDLAMEKGTRTGGAYREDFWRATVSLRVSGF